MIVRDCRACPHIRERSFSTYHEPKNYHPIGFKHVYAWCEINKCRCREVKARNCAAKKEMNQS